LSLRPKYKRVPSADNEARVSEAGMLMAGWSIRFGGGHGDAVSGRVET